MAMVGLMGAGMELVFGKHAGQSHEVSRISNDARVHVSRSVRKVKALRHLKANISIGSHLFDQA